MKLRADAKDFVIFIVFCVVLLYFVAIGVLNISSFATNQKLAGLNPIPAFTGENLAPTMVFFLVALIGIMTSVSSLFFEREKGFGIATTKKDKGYARWATDKEMKSKLKLVNPSSEKSDAAGIPLINNGKQIWVDNGEFHNLIIGSTGSGKTEMLVQPMVKILAKKGESMIITDPKGEIYENNAEELRNRGYNVVLLNFRDPQKGNAWNPLTLPYTLYKTGNKDKANELLDDLAMNILYDEKAQNQDPFWEKTSADYFTGLSLALFDDAKEEEINLNSINLMTTVGEEKIGPTTYVKEYFSTKDPASPAYVNAASTLMAPSDTKGSILAVFKQKIKLFSSRENLSEMLSHSDFDMKDIGRKKTAVFIVIQDEKKTYHSLVTIFIKQCYETLIDVAQENGGKLPFRTNFILDEFANMPPLKDVTTMVTAARSRAIRFSFIIQNFSQLYQVYGKENGETIKGNCGNIIYLISSEIGALEEISKMCGEVKSKEKDKTASTPLVTVSDLQRLKQWTIIVLRTRMMPFKTVMTPNFKMENNNAWGKKYPKATYPTREKQPVAVFDLKAFVGKIREQKNKQMMDMFNPSSSTPLGGMSNMPFGRNDTMPSFPDFPSMPGLPSGGGMNLDDLVKRIDAKIAEIEEEERQEKEKQEQSLPSLENILKEEKIDDTQISDSLKQENIPPLASILKELEIPSKEKDVISAEKDTILPLLNSKNSEESIQEKIPSLKENDMNSTIKEVKKEEKSKQEKKKEEKSSVWMPTLEEIMEEEKSHKITQEKKKNEEKIEKPIKSDTVPISKKETKKVDEPEPRITDDQFFDDFFCDDED